MKTKEEIKLLHHQLINHFNCIQGFVELLEMSPDDKELLQQIKEVLPIFKKDLDRIIE